MQARKAFGFRGTRENLPRPPAELDRRAASARKKEHLGRVRVRVRVRIGVRVGVMVRVRFNVRVGNARGSTSSSIQPAAA